MKRTENVLTYYSSCLFCFCLGDTYTCEMFSTPYLKFPDQIHTKISAYYTSLKCICMQCIMYALQQSFMSNFVFRSLIVQCVYEDILMIQCMLLHQNPCKSVTGTIGRCSPWSCFRNSEFYVVLIYFICFIMQCVRGIWFDIQTFLIFKLEYVLYFCFFTRTYLQLFFGSSA